MKTVLASAVLLVLVTLTGCASSDRPLLLQTGAAAVYPEDAKRQGIEGEVEVAYGVSVDGRVVRAEVVRASPEGVFEEAALASVRRWQFSAPVIDGTPRAVDRVSSVIRFRLDGAQRYEVFDDPR